MKETKKETTIVNMRIAYCPNGAYLFLNNHGVSTDWDEPDNILGGKYPTGTKRPLSPQDRIIHPFGDITGKLKLGTDLCYLLGITTIGKPFGDFPSSIEAEVCYHSLAEVFADYIESVVFCKEMEDYIKEQIIKHAILIDDYSIFYVPTIWTYTHFVEQGFDGPRFESEIEYIGIFHSPLLDT